MSWVLIINSAAKKQLNRISEYYFAAVTQAINELKVNPFAGDIEKMEGESNVWRRRVGSYRIFYELDITEKVVLVFRIKRRTSTTY